MGKGRGGLVLGVQPPDRVACQLARSAGSILASASRKLGASPSPSRLASAGVTCSERSCPIDTASRAARHCPSACDPARASRSDVAVREPHCLRNRSGSTSGWHRKCVAPASIEFAHDGWYRSARRGSASPRRVASITPPSILAASSPSRKRAARIDHRHRRTARQRKRRSSPSPRRAATTRPAASRRRSRSHLVALAEAESTKTGALQAERVGALRSVRSSLSIPPSITRTLAHRYHHA
jgi:hypothetical protein